MIKHILLLGYQENWKKKTIETEEDGKDYHMRR